MKVAEGVTVPVGVHEPRQFVAVGLAVLERVRAAVCVCELVTFAGSERVIVCVGE